MTIQFKNFRSPGEELRVTSESGHIGIINKEFAPLPSILWREAYAVGAISEDMVSTDLNTFIEGEKAKKADELAKERESIKDSLRTAFSNPVSYLDKNDNLIHRKVVALVGKPIRKDLIDELWAEIASEQKDK